LLRKKEQKERKMSEEEKKEENTIKPEDFAKLQADLEAERESRKKLEAKNREILQEKADAKKAADEAAAAAAKKSGDVEALEKSWQDKIKLIVEEKDSVISVKDKALRKATIDAKATEMAADIALPKSAKKVKRFIEDRLDIRIDDDGNVTYIILDANGKPSASTLDELRQDVQNDEGLAPMLVGSKGSGGGDVGKGGKGGASKVTRSEFDAMNPTQKMEVATKARKGELKIVDD